LSLRELKGKNILECIYNHHFEDLVSLRNLLEVKDKPNEETRLLMIVQLLKAVNAVHDEKLIHGNINIDNIFWNSSKSKLVLGLPRY
jgi:serine/threonine protein kinase